MKMENIKINKGPNLPILVKEVTKMRSLNFLDGSMSMARIEDVFERLTQFFPREEVYEIKISNLNTKKDILSSIFEKLSKKRKEYAQFYTHQELVDFIFDNIEIDKNSKILDPACGAGAFLLGALKRNNENINNVYGIDIDPLALKLCKLNIELNNDIQINNLLNKNTLKKLNLEKDFGDVVDSGGFDVIIGNPPFMNLKRDNEDFSLEDPLFKKVVNGVANSATLMIVKSFELLKEGGFLGFVLPKNLARVNSFIKLRKFILENFKIKIILDLNHHFKDVRGDQMILILQKEKSEEKRLNNKVLVIPYKKNMGFDKAESYSHSYKLDQEDFLKYSFFPIFSNPDVLKLANKMLQIDKKLKDYGEIFRGISISSSHPSLSHDLKGTSKVCFRGDSIKRFGIKYPLYIDVSILGNGELTKAERLKKDKIILQNICSKEGGIFATNSSKEELSLDTVTNIIPEDLSLLKYFTGLFNSKISNFFMIFVIYLNSNFTMHTDKTYIGEMPILIPDKNELNVINKLVDNLLSEKDKYSEEFFNIYNKLNQHLYRVYGFDNSEIKIIEESLTQAMSKKQNGRTHEQFYG